MDDGWRDVSDRSARREQRADALVAWILTASEDCEDAWELGDRLDAWVDAATASTA